MWHSPHLIIYVTILMFLSVIDKLEYHKLKDSMVMPKHTFIIKVISFFHVQVWVCILPRGEAERRICERDGCTTDQAQQRLSRQLPDSVKVNKANVVFSTYWDYSYTAQQVLTAWRRLQSEGRVGEPNLSLPTEGASQL